MKPAAGQEVRHLSPDQKQIVDRVEAAKIKLGYVNDAEFIRDHIVGSKQQGRMSDSTYRRLREDVYTGQPSEHIEHLAAIAEKLEDMIFVQTKRAVEQRPFHDLSVFKAVFNAVEMAKERTDNKRLVIYLAQQGGGKTAVCDQLVSRYKAIKINVTPSWKRGPFPAYADICRHLGDGGPWKSTKAAENAMFRALNNRAPGILALDEGDSLGGESLNVLKFILNDTRWVIALFTLPALWDQMRKRTWLYSDQITRRALAIIDLDERLIRPGDVAPFMDRFKFNGEAGQIYKLVAEAANDWGAFDMVETIAANLDLIRNGTIPFKDKAAIPQVLHATAIARKNWRLHRYPPRKKAML